MFGDMKGNGFDLEATHLRHTDKLNRLTLAVSLLYVRLLALGIELTKLGRAREVDRPDSRDLSFFRRGFDFLKRCLALKRFLRLSKGLKRIFINRNEASE
jgi:hypothetical protein